MKARPILSEVNSALTKFKWGQGRLTLQVGKKKQIAYSAHGKQGLSFVVVRNIFSKPR